MSRAAVIDEVLGFWFDYDAADEPVFRDVWFQEDDDFDAEVRDRFEDHYHWAAEGHYDTLARKPLGCLTLVILLDQVPRNLFRGGAQAYATDGMALAHARMALLARHDRELDWARRMFLYMPFMHAEDIAAQERSVLLFATVPVEACVEAALEHHAIIREFGRFPHRNAVLGRMSTEAEKAFLAKHGRGF
ncbi:MAG: DUF924 domain-containing protein [Rhodospirillales bacterium CG15_BIG_FIL_POST_REV_8_21_14_020_66_15]|nr:MAG: DUF924 domain-containing protein [Rhodospirillales bacterium CG15_BIG_FIL_POST_REV_8_21_14_020_66_15]